jgi:hypothetical protein
MSGSNTPAYLSGATVTEKKRFLITFTPEIWLQQSPDLLRQFRRLEAEQWAGGGSQT